MSTYPGSMWPTTTATYYEFEPRDARAIIALRRETDPHDHVVMTSSFSDADVLRIANCLVWWAQDGITADRLTEPALTGARRIVAYVEQNAPEPIEIEVVDHSRIKPERLQ